MDFHRKNSQFSREFPIWPDPVPMFTWGEYCDESRQTIDWDKPIKFVEKRKDWPGDIEYPAEVVGKRKNGLIIIEFDDGECHHFVECYPNMINGGHPAIYIEDPAHEEKYSIENGVAPNLLNAL